MSKDNNFTKECIKEAFIKLISENEYKKISITNITDKAGINRTSFYKFYETKDALLEDIKNRLFETTHYFVENFDNVKNRKEYINELVNTVYKYKTYIIALRNDKLINNGELYNTKVTNLLYKNDNSIEAYKRIGEIGAISGIIIKWMENDFNLEPSKIIEIISKNVYNY